MTAGSVLAALLIPAGMGYAQAAGLPAYAGLYATVVPMLIYAVIGPSRVLVLGPDSSLAPLIAAAVLPFVVSDGANAVALAGVLAVLVGGMLFVGGFLRLGFVTALLSKPLRLGFLNAIALIVVAGQIPRLFGLEVAADGLVREITTAVHVLVTTGPDLSTTMLGVGSLAVILVFRVVDRHVPGVLIAVAGTMAIAYVVDLDGVSVVGALPSGLPMPSFTGVSWADVLHLTAPAAGIALIAFADTGVWSRTFAGRRGEEVDGSAEMRALGAANIVSGVAGGFPISASGSRTAAAEQNGARTQLAGVVGAFLVAAFVFLAPGATAYLPEATLAAVVIIAAGALVDIRGMVRMWRMSTVEFGLATAAFLGVALAGVLQGVAIAIGLSFLAVVAHAWQPYRTELVRTDELPGFHDVRRHPDGHRIPNVVILRFDAPLFFANGTIFCDFVRSEITKRSSPVRWVVLAAEPITNVDTTVVDDLVALHRHLHEQGTDLVFAEMKGPIKDRLIRYGAGNEFTPAHFYPTLHAAIDATQAQDRNE